MKDNIRHSKKGTVYTKISVAILLLISSIYSA